MHRVALVFLLLAGGRAAAAELPPDLPAVSLGMAQAALLEARPAIKRKNYAGVSVPVSRPNNSWNEDLTPEAWPYRHARYDVTDGVLVGVQLTGYPTREELRAARLKAIASAKALWGAEYAAELVVSPLNSVAVSPVLVWMKEGRGVRLTVPPGPDPGSRHALVVSLDVRLPSGRLAPESEIILPDAQRALLFEQCGVEDRRPPGPPEFGVDEMSAAPESLLLDGRTVVLSARFERDYRNLRVGEDAKALTGSFTLRATDGKPFPAGVRFDGAWVRRGWEVWRISVLEELAADRRAASAHERRASASGGPRWPALEADAVVRVIDRDGRALLLRARRQKILAVGFGR